MKGHKCSKVTERRKAFRCDNQSKRLSSWLSEYLAIRGDVPDLLVTACYWIENQPAESWGASDSNYRIIAAHQTHNMMHSATLALFVLHSTSLAHTEFTQNVIGERGIRIQHSTCIHLNNDQCQTIYGYFRNCRGSAVQCYHLPLCTLETHLGYKCSNKGGMLAQQLALEPHSKMFVGLNRGRASSCLEAGSPPVCVGFLPPSKHMQFSSTWISKLSRSVNMFSMILFFSPLMFT